MVRKISLTKCDKSPGQVYSPEGGHFRSGAAVPKAIGYFPGYQQHHEGVMKRIDDGGEGSASKVGRFDSMINNCNNIRLSADTEPNEILKHWISGVYNNDYYNYTMTDLNVTDHNASIQAFSLPSTCQPQSITGISRCSPAGRSSTSGFSDSRSCTSNSTSISSELDDSVILDEILSMEEEQQLRRSKFVNQRSINGSERERTLSLFEEEILQNSILNGDTSQVAQSNHRSERRIVDDPEDSQDSEFVQSIDDIIKEETSQEPTGMRDRRKKDVHNMIERRRRYNINDKIRELGSLLPKARTQSMKMNKGSILRASVEYLRVVNLNQGRMLDLVRRQKLLEIENKQMEKRIEELEQELRTHGIRIPLNNPIPEPNLDLLANADSLDKHSFTGTQYLPVKSEPLDEENFVDNPGRRRYNVNKRLPPSIFTDQQKSINNPSSNGRRQEVTKSPNGHLTTNTPSSHSLGHRSISTSVTARCLTNRRRTDSSVIRDLLLSQVTRREEGTAALPLGIPAPPSSPPFQSASSITVDNTASSFAAYLLNDCYTNLTGSDVHNNNNNNNYGLNSTNGCFSGSALESYAPSPVDLSDFDWCDGDASSSLNGSLFDSRDQSDFVLA